jgi:Spy/CpxP family protein refolding chaperone
LAAAFGAALMIVPAGFAQTATEGQTTTQSRQAHKHQWHEQLAKKLGLTQPQKDKLKAMRQSTRSQVLAIRNNDQLSQEEKHAQLQQLRQQKRTQMESILTPAQQQKLAEIRKNHKGEYGRHGGQQMGHDEPN